MRSRASQTRGRIPGAVWIDSHAFDDSLRAGRLNDRIGQEVIVYCDCPNEASAAVIAKKLMRAGFKRVRPLGGGMFDPDKTAPRLHAELPKLAGRWLGDVERRLEGREWIACADFTVADIMSARWRR